VVCTVVDTFAVKPWAESLKPEKLPGWFSIRIGAQKFQWMTHGFVWTLAVAFATPWIVDFRAEDEKDLPTTMKHQWRRVFEMVKKEYDGAMQQGPPGDYKASGSKEANWFAAIDTLRDRSPPQPTKPSEMPENHRQHVLAEALEEAWGESRGAIISISAYAAIAKLMKYFGMTKYLGSLIMDGLADNPGVYVLFVPIIGFVGAGLVGSSTTATFLFAQLQMNTCLELGIIVPGTRNSPEEVAAMQLIGASAGEIISPSNAIISKILINSNKVDPSEPEAHEGHIIRSTIPVFVLWLALCILLALGFLLPQGGSLDCLDLSDCLPRLA